MLEVKGNIRPGWERAGVSPARCEKCGLGKLVEG